MVPRFSRLVLSLALCLISLRAAGETPVWDVFTAGERIYLQIHFKWGLLNPKAGDAILGVERSEFRGTDAWQYQLYFQTTGFFERVFSMRDTLTTYFSHPETRLLYAEKRSNEGDYYSVDELTFLPTEDDSIRVRSLRYTRERVKIDTLLTASAPMLDMLSATMYLRTMDWTKLRQGEAVPFRVAIGRDVVRAAFRYTGQEVVERDSVKYRTRHFFIDVYDEAFTQSRAAGEAWIGDDENHLPIKVRAKLKIGAAEAHFVRSENTRVPIQCAVTIHK